jgi:hypothetical protein
MIPFLQARLDPRALLSLLLTAHVGKDSVNGGAHATARLLALQLHQPSIVTIASVCGVMVTCGLLLALAAVGLWQWAAADQLALLPAAAGRVHAVCSTLWPAGLCS